MGVHPDTQDGGLEAVGLERGELQTGRQSVAL